MVGKIFRGCLLALLALLACPVVALAEPIYAMSFVPADQIVGGSAYEGAATPWTGRAFLYQDGTMHELGSIAGWDSIAYDIVDDQQILGKACRGDACMPMRPDLVSALPEPGSYALLAAGLVLLAGWRKSGRRESLRFSQPCPRAR